MVCLNGFELHSRWVPSNQAIATSYTFQVNRDNERSRRYFEVSFRLRTLSN